MLAVGILVIVIQERINFQMSGIKVIISKINHCVLGIFFTIEIQRISLEYRHKQIRKKEIASLFCVLSIMLFLYKTQEPLDVECYKVRGTVYRHIWVR